jgi:PhzF family phenazine biosynthesis protein
MDIDIMTTSRIIYQVDAFTSKPFKGNPAGVCILKKEMPESWMQNIATEIHVSETAFISGGKKEFNIRYFTPASEVPLCGHATLSSAHIMYETGIVEREKKITFLSKAGKLIIRTEGSWITMNFPAYPLKRIRVPRDINKYIGIKPEELYRTGHGWIFVLLKSESDVRNLKPDFGLMKNSPYGDLIVTAPSADKDFDFCVRCFAPALGIDEDPVTGSAHCSLAPFWSNRTGRKKFVSHQVSEREGILKVELKNDRVEISGQAKTVLKGELFV